MNAEHRKELQTNVLANQMGKLVQGISSKPNPSTLVVTVFIVLVIGLIAGFMIYNRSSDQARSKQWVALSEVGSTEDLDKFAKEHSGSLPARVSRFQRARVLLNDGLQNLFSMTGRGSALKNLEEAEEIYQQLAKESTDTPLLHQEALMGVAKSREARGDLTEARKVYDDLATRFPKYPLGEAAKKHLEQLDKNPDIKGFYSKLNELADSKPAP